MNSRRIVDKIFIEKKIWPLWPILTFVRNKDGKNTETAFLFDVDVEKPVLYVGNIFSLMDGSVRGISTSDLVKNLKTHEYQNVDAMLDDGWRVD